jgi:hypothetical protein
MTIICQFKSFQALSSLFKEKMNAHLRRHGVFQKGEPLSLTPRFNGVGCHNFVIPTVSTVSRRYTPVGKVLIPLRSRHSASAPTTRKPAYHEC